MITGLTNGQLYDVQIRAVNAVGGGAESAVVPDVKPYGLPAAVVGLHASPAPSSVTLTWDPVDDNGSPITAYNVIRWISAAEGWIVDSVATTATTHTFTGLTIGSYYYTIEATNAAGTGPRSAPRTTAVVTEALPDAPWDVSTSVDDAAMTMTWISGDAGTSPINGHLVRVLDRRDHVDDDVVRPAETRGVRTAVGLDAVRTAGGGHLRARNRRLHDGSTAHRRDRRSVRCVIARRHGRRSCQFQR